MHEFGVEHAEAAVKKARSNLAQAHAQVQARLGQVRGNWFRRKNVQERIRQQLATLRSDVAALRARESSLWPAAHNAVGLAGESPVVGIDCLPT